MSIAALLYLVLYFVATGVSKLLNSCYCLRESAGKGVIEACMGGAELETGGAAESPVILD